LQSRADVGAGATVFFRQAQAQRAIGKAQLERCNRFRMVDAAGG
jgi:hypothetical protein